MRKGDVMSSITWAKERYKNDKEYLEYLKQKNREECRYSYKKRKERQKDDDICGSADNSTNTD